jgi:hypothetical protein
VIENWPKKYCNIVRRKRRRRRRLCRNAKIGGVTKKELKKEREGEKKEGNK